MAVPPTVSLGRGLYDEGSGEEREKASDGGVMFAGNDALRTLRGLEGLTSIGGLVLNGMDHLSDISGLQGLETVSGDVLITNNDWLVEVDGPERLREIGGTLWIHETHALTDLRGLRGVSAVGELYIQNNNCLETGEALALRDAIGTDNITGSIIIVDNAGPCD